MNLAHRLTEYGEKLEKVPEKNQCEVDPQIGTPILDHLSHTTNDEIADLFTTLLANASNLETLDKAYPSFAHIISRLSVDEARIIKYLTDKAFIPYCSFHAQNMDNNNDGFITVDDHATLLPYEINFFFPENVQAYLSNLSGLGIFEDNNRMYLMDESYYDEICEKYHIEKMRREYKESGYRDVECIRSFYMVTPFGRLFIDACIKD